MSALPEPLRGLSAERPVSQGGEYVRVHSQMSPPPNATAPAARLPSGLPEVVHAGVPHWGLCAHHGPGPLGGLRSAHLSSFPL